MDDPVTFFSTPTIKQFLELSGTTSFQLCRGMHSSYELYVFFFLNGTQSMWSIARIIPSIHPEKLSHGIYSCAILYVNIIYFDIIFQLFTRVVLQLLLFR